MSEEPPTSGIAVSVVTQDAAWNELLDQPEELAKRASLAVLRDETLEPVLTRLPQDAELSIVLGNDKLVRKLNRAYRNVDGSTNVLSFANLDGPAEKVLDTPYLLGDVVLALETVRTEAREQGKPAADHLAHLVVHGVLHLLGYDHQSDRDADRMEQLERRILARLGVADPYERGDQDLLDIVTR